MLILIFIFTFIRHMHGTSTSTLPIHGSDPTDLFARDDLINHHLGTRQVSDIVINCLATIFACTWTAIHPNIPAPCDSGWEIFKRQVTTMIYGILAPEAITGWALRQHIAARRLVKNYNRQIKKKYKLVERSKHRWFQRKTLPPVLGKGEGMAWTMTHGFLLQMGGFVLRKDGHPIHTLIEYEAGQGSSIITRIDRGDIWPPSITEAEIEDRSKGDGLTKTFVVLQTTWFIVQCIVRWSSSLPVTELEVVTLGFAMLNGITYGLWWNKPQSVGLPVYLGMKDSEGAGAMEGVSELEESQREHEGQSLPTENPAVAVVGEAEHTMVEGEDTERGADVVQGGERPGEVYNQSTNGQKRAPAEETVLPAKRSYLSKKLNKYRGTGWQLIWRIPYQLIQATLRPLSKMMEFPVSVVYLHDLRLPMFHSVWVGDDNRAFVYMSSSAIASIFGLIHLIPGWFLQFPSHPEMVLWRVSAGIITTQPIVLGIWSWKEDGEIWSKKSKSSALAILALFGLPLYIIARLALIFLALLSLRKLEKDAFVAVDWISFIPHI